MFYFRLIIIFLLTNFFIIYKNNDNQLNFLIKFNFKYFFYNKLK